MRPTWSGSTHSLASCLTAPTWHSRLTSGLESCRRWRAAQALEALGNGNLRQRPAQAPLQLVPQPHRRRALGPVPAGTRSHPTSVHSRKRRVRRPSADVRTASGDPSPQPPRRHQPWKTILRAPPATCPASEGLVPSCGCPQPGPSRLESSLDGVPEVSQGQREQRSDPALLDMLVALLPSQ